MLERRDGVSKDESAVKDGAAIVEPHSIYRPSIGSLRLLEFDLSKTRFAEGGLSWMSCGNTFETTRSTMNIGATALGDWVSFLRPSAVDSVHFGTVSVAEVSQVSPQICCPFDIAIGCIQFRSA